MAKRVKTKKKRSCLGTIVYWVLFGVFVYFGVSALSYADTLKFAHVTDVHLSDKSIDTSYKLLSHSQEILADVVAQINGSSNIDFVVETGDLIDKPRKDFLEIACNEMTEMIE